MSDNEIFILGSNKKHDVGRITRTIDEAVVLIERIFQSRISCGISVSREKIEDMPSLYEQALEALDYNLVTVEEVIRIIMTSCRCRMSKKTGIQK